MCVSPASVSLSDSLSSSELELLDRAGPDPWSWFWSWLWFWFWPSSSSSSAGLQGSVGAGCFSLSCRQIFSLLLRREIEVLQGRGRVGGTGGMQEPISEGLIPRAANQRAACSREAAACGAERLQRPLQGSRLTDPDVPTSRCLDHVRSMFRT